jgi:hypothetical protein
LSQAFEDGRVLESIRPPDNLFGNAMALVLADCNVVGSGREVMPLARDRFDRPDRRAYRWTRPLTCETSSIHYNPDERSNNYRA